MAGSFIKLTAERDFVNCPMAENVAGLDGGAIAVSDGAEPFLIHCTLADNTVSGGVGFGGAVSCVYDGNDEGMSYVLLENSIAWGNLAVYGPQAAVGDPSSIVNQFAMLELSYSIIEGGAAEVSTAYPYWNSLVYENLGVIDADPKFIQGGTLDPTDASTRTFYLAETQAGQFAPTSPAVNAGIGTAAALEEVLGFEVTTRTDHIRDTGVVDLGFHYDASAPVETFDLTILSFWRDYYAHGNWPLKSTAIASKRKKPRRKPLPLHRVYRFALRPLPIKGIGSNAGSAAMTIPPTTRLTV